MTNRRAAVAVVVSHGDAGDEILLVRRATVEGDPWSGHIALPGGGFEPADASLEVTARRETLEETGIDLSGSECVAALAIVRPRSTRAPTISVAAYVFRHHGDRRITLSDELVEAWWYPVADLRHREAWGTEIVTVADGSTLEVRGMKLHGHILWGLTERILDEFLRSWI